MTDQLTKETVAGLSDVVALALADYEELLLDDPDRAARVLAGIEYLQGIIHADTTPGSVLVYGMPATRDLSRGDFRDRNR